MLTTKSFLAWAILVAAAATDYVHHHHNYYGSVHNHHRAQSAASRYDDDHDDDPHVEHHKETRTRYDDDDDHDDDRSYLFMLSGTFGAYEYTDSDGYMKGFHPSLVKKVCAKAGKRCYWTFDALTNCWQTSGDQALPGQGLMDSWYDGCVGLFPTPERRNSFNFTQPHTGPLRSALRFRGDRGPTVNLKGLRIGFGDGWTLSPECLGKQEMFRGNQPGDYEARFYPSAKALRNGLVKGEIHAILIDYDTEPHTDEEMQQFSDPFVCASEGCSIMVRYGSDVTEWWNRGINDLIDSGEYDEFCTHAQSLHADHGRIHCLDTGRQ